MPVALKPPAKPSGSIKELGYDLASRTLAVRFQNSDLVHHYTGVPPDEIEALHAAESIGSHFAKRIRNNPEFAHSTPNEDDAPIERNDGVTLDPRAAWPLPTAASAA